jgi:F-type H+-transporting ATPase subunit b
MLRRIVLFLALGVTLLGPLAPAAPAADPAGAESKPPLLANPFGDDHHAAAARRQAVWVLVIFVILLAILYPTAWKNVLAGLKAREARIRQDIADAEAARTRAEATLKEYNVQLAAAESKVRDMIAGAVTQGERVAADIRAKAVAEADESRQRALREIEAARKQALAEIYERAAELSTGIAEKILKRNINADDQRDLVRRSLEELQTVQR